MADHPTHPYETDDLRWDALIRRDARADEAFRYAVRTTGIYCRPSCRSRRPNRAHVRFFADSTAAERAGFRACRRCLPRGDHPDARRAAVVAEACRLLEGAESTPSLAHLAASLNTSPSHLHRLFKRVLGLTPREYAMTVRQRRLRDRLHAPGSVTSAIYDAGFAASSRAYEAAGSALGMTPGQFKRGADRQTIRFALAPTTLGWLVVAATDRGVCAIELGDNPEDLEAGLRTRFPGATTLSEAPDLAEWLRRILEAIERPGTSPEIPLDIRATAFQGRVWEALRSIPPGATTRYAELAQQLGCPAAVRAVARACATNPVAIVIPCHRVVRTGGGLGGYRWGLDRKRALLDREAQIPIEGESPLTPGEAPRRDGPFPRR